MDSTLYYVLSTIPQVLAATAGLLAAFVHFRLKSLSSFLIGEGKVFQERWGDKGYIIEDKFENVKYRNRLRDAVLRNNVSEVDEVIKKLRDIEKEQKLTRKDRPRGLQFLYEERFLKTRKQMNRIRNWTFGSIAISFFTILWSVFWLINVVKLTVNCSSVEILYLTYIFLFISIVTTFKTIYLGLHVETSYENIPSGDESID